MTTEVELDAREIDAQVAEWLGWKQVEVDSVFRTHMWERPDGVRVWHVPPYSSVLYAAYEMEEKIKELGLEVAYAVALLLELGIVKSGYIGSGTVIIEAEEVFALAHASAEMRARAALMVVKTF